MRALATSVPSVHLALVASDGRTVWVARLLDVTVPAGWAWVGLLVLSAVGELAASVLEWGLSYSALLLTLLAILLAALLWGLTPQPRGTGRGRGHPSWRVGG